MTGWKEPLGKGIRPRSGKWGSKGRGKKFNPATWYSPPGSYGGVPVSTGCAKLEKHGEIADNLRKRRHNQLNANHNVYAEVPVAA